MNIDEYNTAINFIKRKLIGKKTEFGQITHARLQSDNNTIWVCYDFKGGWKTSAYTYKQLIESEVSND